MGHGRIWFKVTKTKKICMLRFEKAKSGILRRKTRVSTGQEQERETKSGGRAVTGGAVMQYP